MYFSIANVPPEYCQEQSADVSIVSDQILWFSVWLFLHIYNKTVYYTKDYACDMGSVCQDGSEGILS